MMRDTRRTSAKIGELPVSDAPWVCDDCRRGNHRGHDRLTGDGTDAGCPGGHWEGHRFVAACSCAVRLPTDPRMLANRCPTCGKPR